eukprot:m.189051 g.189051  ORF g.189051 m.189051 type:complete len:385 (-) comp24845_c0_seq1:117-1271(-)
MGPLAGTVVVDLTRQLAGPQCTRVLSDLGATVIKVEQAGSKGDMMATNPVVVALLAKNKERVTLDLKHNEGKAHLERLLDGADVLVENFRPGVMAAMGFGWERIQQRWPRVVMCSVSGFGQTGPLAQRPAMDVVIQAMSGVMSTTGFEDKPPVGAGVLIADVNSGLYAAIGVLGALAGRNKNGRGAHVDVAMLDVMAAVMAPKLVRSLNDYEGYVGEEQPPRTGSAGSAAPFDTFRCSDGFIALVGLQPHFYTAICDVIERPSMKAEVNPQFRTARLRKKHYDVFKPALEEALSTRTVAEWVDRFAAAGVPCGAVNTLAQALREPQLHARNMISEIGGESSSSFHGIKTMSSPINISGYDPEVVWCAEKNEHAAKYGISSKAKL